MLLLSQLIEIYQVQSETADSDSPIEVLPEVEQGENDENIIPEDGRGKVASFP